MAWKWSAPFTDMPRLGRPRRSRLPVQRQFHLWEVWLRTMGFESELQRQCLCNLWHFRCHPAGNDAHGRVSIKNLVFSLTYMLTLVDEWRVQDQFFGTTNFKTGVFTQTFSDGNFTYNSEDVIQSSVLGWIDYGYKYATLKNASVWYHDSQCPNSYTLVNGNYGFSPGALDSVTNFREQLFAIANIRSNTGGVFNLPVCVLNELSSMPQCWKAIPTNYHEGAAQKTPLSWDEISNCYIHPVNCLGGKWLVSSWPRDGTFIEISWHYPQINLAFCRRKTQPTVSNTLKII